jgi:hypothetical protein
MACFLEGGLGRLVPAVGVGVTSLARLAAQAPCLLVKSAWLGQCTGLEWLDKGETLVLPVPGCLCGAELVCAGSSEGSEQSCARHVCTADGPSLEASRGFDRLTLPDQRLGPDCCSCRSCTPGVCCCGLWTEQSQTVLTISSLSTGSLMIGVSCVRPVQNRRPVAGGANSLWSLV